MAETAAEARSSWVNPGLNTLDSTSPAIYRAASGEKGGKNNRTEPMVGILY